jgi:hypothetical protein
MSTIEEIKATALEELEERFKAEPDIEISELADSSVPVYTHELITIAQNSTDVMYHENELGPAFDGTPTIPNIIATAIYEIVQETLYEKLYELQQEYEAEQEQEETLEL